MGNEQVGIEIRDEGKVTIVFVRGEITLLDAPELRKSVDAAVNAGARKLLFDFEKLTFLDSSGIGLLFRFHAQLRKIDGKIAYINFQKTVANTMQKALPQPIREASYFDTKEKAVEYLNA
jgi:stage II sporulation protein AA (anti-sigma F factor antagonist)